MVTEDRPKPRRRRLLQFSLRSLLIFVLLVSIGMSWLGVKLERARRQREAVRVVRAAGGYAWYDYEWEDRFAEPPVPGWLRGLVGDDFFDVVAVTVWRGDFGDDEMIYLRRLTKLEMIGICYAQITDAGLEYLEGLTNLTDLILTDTQITDAGLKHLEGLTSLHSLDVRSNQVTPEGVANLQEALPECEIVYDE